MQWRLGGGWGPSYHKDRKGERVSEVDWRVTDFVMEKKLEDARREVKCLEREENELNSKVVEGGFILKRDKLLREARRRARAYKKKKDKKNRVKIETAKEEKKKIQYQKNVKSS